MTQSSISLSFLVLIGCALLAVNAELTPFYDFQTTYSDSRTKSDGIRNKIDTNSMDPEQRQLTSLRARNLAGRYGSRNGGKHHGHKGADDYYECESFYSKSHKKDKKSKKDKKEKHYKHDKKKCKNVTGKPIYDDDAVEKPKPPRPDRPYKDFMRFIMVREEVGSPAAGDFGVGDTLALNGQIYYWEDYDDNLMSDVPVGTFVTLCTGISEAGDDLMCTYEIVLGLLADRTRNGNRKNGNAGNTKTPIQSVGAFVANGPNYVSENYMIVTGTEFEFAGYQTGTMVTTEDLVNPYLYADLYLA